MLFVDVTKAFPTVWLDGLWKQLWNKGVQGKCLRVLHGLYQGAKRVVSHDGVVSAEFTCNLGLHEGDPISPTLYLYFIDDLLKEVYAKHPGVQIVDCSTGAVSDVAAAMQADDLVVVCESLEEIQAVAKTVYAYSKKWRFKLNSVKSAVMHVAIKGASRLSESGIIWNGVPVPVTSRYCYLGLWFQNTLAWDVHFDHIVKKVQNATKRYMPIWKSRHINVEVKRIVLLSCVRPIIEYGSEVWIPTCQQQSKLDSMQTDILKTCMHILKDNPCNKAVLAEWGLKPMHQWLHERILIFYAKLRLMPDCRLPKKVFNGSWKKNGRIVMLPWHKHVGTLLLKYGLNCNYEVLRYSECKSVIKSSVKSVWQDDLTLKSTLDMSTLKRYVDWVCPKLVESLSLKSPRPYLQAMLPTYGVELFMRVRLSCLPVKCRTARFRRRDDGDDFSEVEERMVDRQRLLCPACHSADESLSHLLFDCPASQAARRVMFDQIKGVEGCDAKLTACLSIQNEKERVCRFVSDDIWGSADTLQCVLPCITQYLASAWKVRCRCEHNGGIAQHGLLLSASEMGRGADGRIAMADG